MIAATDRNTFDKSNAAAYDEYLSHSGITFVANNGERECVQHVQGIADLIRIIRIIANNVHEALYVWSVMTDACRLNYDALPTAKQFAYIIQ